MSNGSEKYPEGHFIGIWMAIGIAIFSGIGIPLSIVTDNYGFIGIGPALGVAIGLAIGQSVENRYKGEGRIRPLTRSEWLQRKALVAACMVAFALGVVVFLVLLLI